MVVIDGIRVAMERMVLEEEMKDDEPDKYDAKVRAFFSRWDSPTKDLSDDELDMVILLREVAAEAKAEEREACVVAVRAVVVDPQDYYAAVDAIRKRGTP